MSRLGALFLSLLLAGALGLGRFIPVNNLYWVLLVGIPFPLSCVGLFLADWIRQESAERRFKLYEGVDPTANLKGFSDEQWEHLEASKVLPRCADEPKSADADLLRPVGNVPTTDPNLLLRVAAGE